MKARMLIVSLLHTVILSCASSETTEEVPLLQIPPVCAEAKPVAPAMVYLPVFGPPQGDGGPPWEYNAKTDTLEVVGVDEFTKVNCQNDANTYNYQYLYFKSPIDLSGWPAENKTIQITIRQRYDLPQRLFADYKQGLLTAGKILVYDEEPPQYATSLVKQPKPIAEWAVTGTHWPDYETVTYFMDRPLSKSKIWLALKDTSACHGLLASEWNRFGSSLNNRWEIASIQVNAGEQNLSEHDRPCIPALASVSVPLEKAVIEETDKVNWKYQPSDKVLMYEKNTYLTILPKESSHVKFPTVSVKNFPSEVRKLQIKVSHQYSILPEFYFIRNQQSPVRFCLPQAEILAYDGEDPLRQQQLGQLFVSGPKEEMSTISYVVPRPTTDNLSISLHTALDYFGDTGDTSTFCSRPNPSWKISKIEILPYTE